MRICVDASLAIKWLVSEPDSARAMQILQTWRQAGALLIAPSLFDYEIGTVLRQKLLQGEVTGSEIHLALTMYRRLELQLFHVTDLILQALALADTLKQPAIYDISYLLLAQQQKADFVTADLRFCRIAQPLFPFVKYFRDVAAEKSL